VVAAEKEVGHLHAAEDARAGVLRILQPAGFAVRLLDDALLITKDAGHIAHDRVDHDHGRHLAAVADEVADRNLPGPQTQPDAFVEALVAAAEQD